MDEPAFPGVLVPSRLIGVIEGEQIDGKKRVSEILSHALFAPFEPEQRTNFARAVCERMWRSGHLLFGRA